MNRLISLVAFLCVLPVAVAAITVQPGLELYKIESGTCFEFTGPTTIPQGFFGPGSDPFVGTVAFTGQVIATYPGCAGDIGLAHVILRRTESADLPFPGSTDQVPIEMVALSLTSIDPITITYNQGANPEIWGAVWGSSDEGSGETLISIFTFLSESLLYRFNQVPSRPRLTFTRLADSAQRAIDAGDVQWDSFFDVFTAADVPWRETGDLSEVAQPTCTGNFVGSYDGDPIVTIFTGQHGKLVMRPAPPSQPVAVRPVTWGEVKSRYR